MPETLTTLITFLGGGIIGAGIQYVSTARTAREKRHSDFVYEQLCKLYGPLYFLTSQNEKLFKLSNTILNAHTEHFSCKKWSLDRSTQESLSKESRATIELSNEYIYQASNNNDMIVKILRDNYAFIDPDDIEILQEFVVDSLRMNKEIKKEKLKEIPMEIYYALGDISYSRPEFLSGIKDKFNEKQGILKKYH